MWLSGVLYLFSSQLGRAGKSVSEIVKRYSRVTAKGKAWTINPLRAPLRVGVSSALGGLKFS